MTRQEYRSQIRKIRGLGDKQLIRTNEEDFINHYKVKMPEVAKARRQKRKLTYKEAVQVRKRTRVEYERYLRVVKQNAVKHGHKDVTLKSLRRKNKFNDFVDRFTKEEIIILSIES